LSPGLYEGPGTYTLDPQSKVQVGGRSAPLPSAAYVQFLTRPPHPTEIKYDKIMQPCTMVIAKTSGNVDCPELGDEKGSIVKVRWSWSLV
ncbi:MAG: hypothetical protein ABR579_07355, partial [Actinomycetota bacterium]